MPPNGLRELARLGQTAGRPAPDDSLAELYRRRAMGRRFSPGAAPPSMAGLGGVGVSARPGQTPGDPRFASMGGDIGAAPRPETRGGSLADLGDTAYRHLPDTMRAPPERTPSGLFTGVGPGPAAPGKLPYSLPRGKTGGVSLPWMPPDMDAVWNQRYLEETGRPRPTDPETLPLDVRRASETTRSLTSGSINTIASMLDLPPEQIQAAIDNGTIADLVRTRKAELMQQNQPRADNITASLNASGPPDTGANMSLNPLAPRRF